MKKKNYYGSFVAACRECGKVKKLRSKVRGLCGHCEAQARYGKAYWKTERKTIPPRSKDKCAICGKVTRLVQDHSHELGCHPKKGWCKKCARGHLCPQCNAGLGMFYDSVWVLAKAQEYLKAYSA